MLKMSLDLNNLIYDRNTKLLTYIFRKNSEDIQEKLSTNISQINVNSIIYGISDLVKKNLSIKAVSAKAFYNTELGI